MTTRIEQALTAAREAQRSALIVYLTAGDPSMGETVLRVNGLERVGVDIVELGFPFSDPLADGRVNQDAATRALAGGANWNQFLECIRQIRAHSEIPIVVYTYINPLLARTFERSIRQLAEAGADGVLVVDLPVEEMENYVPVLRKYSLNNICLVTPTSPPERIRAIVGASSGFVYCVSREGVTGAQKQLPQTALSLVRRVRRYTRLPLALGFGLSTPAQVRAAARVADAVVVGSAVVDRFARAPSTEAGREEVLRWVKTLVQAVRHAHER